MKSDLDIKKEVLTRLELEPKIDPSALGVSVEDGVVTLKGTVEDEHERASTERAVRFLQGVKGLVDDELEVKAERRSRPKDAEIKAMASEAIQWLTTVPAEGIEVSARNGWLTLQGTVEAAHQSRCIEEVLRDIPGVRGVKNGLKVENSKAA